MPKSCGSRIMPNAWSTQSLCSGPGGQPFLKGAKGDTGKECTGSIHSCDAQANTPDGVSLHSSAAAMTHSASQAEASSCAQVVQPANAQEGPTTTTSQHRQQRSFLSTPHDASMAATEQRVTCIGLLDCETHAKPATERRGSSASEALAEAADQPLGFGHSINATALAQLGSTAPPEHIRAAAHSSATAPCSQGNPAAAISNPTDAGRPLLHSQSGLFTQLLQADHDTALDDHAGAVLASSHSSAAVGPFGPNFQPLHNQKAQKQQQQQAGTQPTVDGGQQEQLPQSPAEGVKAILAQRPVASPKPCRKRYLPLNHRPDKRRTKAKAATASGTQQAFPHRQWQTLGDVLQDLDINDIIFAGTPMTPDAGVSAVAGPSTPAALPEQYVDTRPLANLHLPEQENRPASSPQPTQIPPPPYTIAGLAGQWPSLYTLWQPPPQQQQEQQQQQQHTASVPQMLPQHQQAAVSDVLPLSFDLLAPCHDAMHMPASTQQRLHDAATPHATSPELTHHATLPQLPLHMGHHGHRSSLDSGGLRDPQSAQSPRHSMELALDRLFSGGISDQPTTSLQRRKRSRQAQQPLTAGNMPTPSAEQCPASGPVACPDANGWDSDTQQGWLPTAPGLHPASQPASSLPPNTPAPGCVQSAVLSSPLQPPWSQWPQPELYMQEPLIQQDVDQTAYPAARPMTNAAAEAAADSAATPAVNPAAEPAAAQHVQLPMLQDGVPAQLQPSSLQHQLPRLTPAAELTKLQAGLDCASSLAVPLQEASLNGCATGSSQHHLTNCEPTGTHPATADDNSHQSLCSASTITRSQSEPDSPAMIAELPLCSPERMSVASSALYLSPVLLWNSPASAASSPIPQQARQDCPPSASRCRPIQEQNSQRDQEQQWQLEPHPLTHGAMEDSPPHAGTSPTSAVQRPSKDPYRCNFFSASTHPPTKMVPHSASATAQLADEQGSSHALEEIALRAKRLLKSLELASSAQLCQDVCGAFEGLPLHGTPVHVHHPLEGTGDQGGLHLDDLHKLGLLPDGASDDLFCDMNTQQQQQQQHNSSYRAIKTHLKSSSNPDSSSAVSQQQQEDSAQPETQHACSTSSSEHQTVDRQVMKGSTAGQVQTHHGAVLREPTVKQAASHRSSVPAALSRHQQQSELLAVPESLKLSDSSAQPVAAERESHDSSHVGQHIAQPPMCKGGARIASEELLRAAGFTASDDEDDICVGMMPSSQQAEVACEADVLQAAALMSGMASMGLTDLHRVCAQWLQVAQTPPPGLQAFGSHDIHAAHSNIIKTLRQCDRFVQCKITDGGTMLWRLRPQEGDVGSGQRQDCLADHCEATFSKAASAATAGAWTQQPYKGTAVVQESPGQLSQAASQPDPLEPVKPGAKECKVRPRRHQTNVATPAQQKQWHLTAQHDTMPHRDATIKVASAQQAAAMTTCDSHSPARHCRDPQQASLSLLSEHHHQQQTTHQGLSKSARARHQGAAPMLLQPHEVTSPQHLRKLRKRADPSGPGRPASGRQVSAREITAHTFSAQDAMNDECRVELVHEQAEALRSSAQAVLASLDWADSQLTCSPLHAAASASDGMHSCASNGQGQAGQVGTAAGETGCEQAPAHHLLHTHTASCRQDPHVDLVSDLGTLHNQLHLEPDAASGPRLAAAAGALHGLSQQQSATCEDGLRRVTSCAAQKEDGRGGRESSGVADSEATWSEGGDLHSSSACLAPPQQEEELLEDRGV